VLRIEPRCGESRPLRASILPSLRSADARRAPACPGLRPSGLQAGKDQAGSCPQRRSPRGVSSRAPGTHSHRSTFAVLFREQVANTRPPGKGRYAETLPRSVLACGCAPHAASGFSLASRPGAGSQVRGTTNSRERWQRESRQPL